MRSAPVGGEGKALASSGNLTLRNNQYEVIRRSDIEALIKLLKDNSGNTLVDTDVIEIPYLDSERDNQAEQNQEDSASHDQAEHHTQEEQDHHTTQEKPVVIASQPQPNNDQVITEDNITILSFCTENTSSWIDDKVSSADLCSKPLKVVSRAVASSLLSIAGLESLFL
ncbi:hypothetical protein F2Q68_00017003 [Brassica cretica]|uniref:Uncharacterized protein n=1 Tax=Brassica cretica TaxID=69181 RepID=A0A8S9HCC9_BRACR|nr:hypothetical protein F2Q68_00017003 [Brassica cretica]